MGGARRFITEYYQGDMPYTSFVFASSLEDANSLCLIRNIGEVILGEIPDYIHECYNSDSSVEALHEACFLSFLAIKAKKLEVDEILGDRGVLHEMIHLLHLSNKKIDAQEFCGQLAHLRKIVPGYEPV